MGTMTSITADINTEIDTTDINVTTAINQVEATVHHFVDEYKTLFLPRVKGSTYYDLPIHSYYEYLTTYTPTYVKWDDIREVYIKDDNGVFQQAKKITDRNYKNSGAYYWSNNNKLCVPPSTSTDAYFARSGYVVMSSYNYSTYGAYEFTANSIKSNFTNLFITGMQITIVGVNGGEYIIESVSSTEIVFKDTVFIVGTYGITIFGAAIKLDSQNVDDISIGDYFVKRYSVALTYNRNEYVDYLVKCSYIESVGLNTIISYAYGSTIDVNRIERVGVGASPIISVFVPGIRITYKRPFSAKALTSILPLMLSREWEEAYNYHIKGKIAEMYKSYDVAKHMIAERDAIIEDFKEFYQSNDEICPADSQIVAEW